MGLGVLRSGGLFAVPGGRDPENLCFAGLLFDLVTRYFSTALAWALGVVCDKVERSGLLPDGQLPSYPDLNPQVSV